jgi:biopolymer transport protein ExbD
MSWQVRHLGSPQTIPNVSTAQVVEGLQEGAWETTDEVLGPNESQWTPIEQHPHFAEAALEIEPPEPKPVEDETRLDMTPLIDVCLVLLIFFILTTSYAHLQQTLPAGEVGREDNRSLRPVNDKDVKESMIGVSAKMEGGTPVIRVADKVVAADDLLLTLRQIVNDTRKVQLLFQHDEDVPYGTIVFVRDKAKGAGIERVLIPVPQ